MTVRFEGRTTRAAVMRGSGQPLVVEELEIAEPAPGEVLVKMVAAGVCHSDLHALSGEWEQPVPAVLGHEGSGVIESLGEGVEDVSVGDHVVLSWTPGCGSCEDCQSGRPYLCTRMDGDLNVMWDGTSRLRSSGEAVNHFLRTAAFSEYVVVPESGAVPIGTSSALDTAAVVGCAVTTGVGAACNTVELQPGEAAVVIGLGGVGLSIVQGCSLRGAHPIIAIDMNDEKLAVARQHGATQAVNPHSRDAVEAVWSLTDGKGAKFAFEAVGLKATIEQALAMLGRRGTAVLVGIPPAGVTVEADPTTINGYEQRIVGSSYGSANPKFEFPKLLRLAEAGRLDLDSMITKRIQLDQINDAFADMRRGEGIRTVVTFP